jgi:uncharacterized protein (TIGR03083 family)
VPVDRLTRTVRATPAWTVHDVLAHVVAITADLNAQRFDGAADGDGDAWTAAQVAARRDASIDDLAAEWDREAPLFETGLRLFGYSFGAHYLGDLLQHVGDIRTTLGIDPTRDDETIAVALDFYLESFEETLNEAALGAVEVHSGDERWTLGTGAVVATVTAPRYELFRALGGRRTLDQIRSLDWTGDAEPIIGLVSRYPPPSELLEGTRR